MSQRLEKVNDQIRDILIAIIHREYGSQYGIITITKVKTSPDLRNARIFISNFQAKTDIVKILNREQKKIRYQLANKISLKNTPQLKFIADDTLKQANKIEELLSRVKNEKQ